MDPIDEPHGPKTVYCNRGFERMTGWSADEILGQTPRVLQVDERDRSERDAIRHAMVRWNNGEDDVGLTCELLNKTKDGEHFWVELQLVPLWGETRRTSYWGSIQRDVTQRRRQQAELDHQRRMNSLGQMAAGIAHDFNNLLGVLLSHTDLLSGLPNLDPSATESLTEMRRAVASGQGLTRGLLAYAQKRSQEREDVDLSDLVASIAPFLTMLLPHGVELDAVDLERGCVVRLDRSQAENAAINLALNAKDAMPDGGRLTISVKRLKHDGGADRVRLTVTDTGQGMTADVLKNIFDPFFTTKDLGKGNGLGLSAVKGFVEESNAVIDVESAPGRGSRFRIEFPIAAQHAAIVKSISDAEAEHRRFVGLSALVSHGDVFMRRALVRLLSRQGFTVTEAADTPGGLQKLYEQGALDLVIFSIGMHTSEDEVRSVLGVLDESGATRLLAIEPSGHGYDEIFAGHPRKDRVARLKGAFTRDAFLAAVTQLFC